MITQFIKPEQLFSDVRLAKLKKLEKWHSKPPGPEAKEII